MKRSGTVILLAVVLSLMAAGICPPAIAGDRAAAEAEKGRGDGLLAQKQLEQALAAYRRAAELDPTWYVPHEAIGKALFSAGRHAEAAEAFKKAVEANPGYFTGLYNIAYALRKAGQIQQAIEYYRQYLAKNPADPDGYYGLAASYETAGDLRQAVSYYQQYTERENRPSERPYVLKAREKIEQLQARLDIAAAPAAKPAPAATPPAMPPPAPAAPAAPPVATATAPAPTASAAATTVAPAASAGAVSTVQRPSLSPDATAVTGPEQTKQLLQQGDQALEMGSYARAMKAYFDVLAKEPRNIEALYGLGRAYQLSGNNQAASLKWKKVLELDPGHQGARLALQRLENAESKTPPVAPTAVEKPAPPALAEKPAPAAAPAASASAASAELRSLLDEGDELLQRKSYSRAIEAYHRAAQADAGNEEAWFKLGVAYALSGNFQAAVYKWQKVLEINPNNLSAQRNIEKARARLPAGQTPPAAPAAPAPAPTAPAVAEKPAAAAPAPPAAVRPAGRPALPGEVISRCQTLLGEGRAQEALAQLDELRQREPRHYAALLWRGEALLALGKTVEARQAFTQALVLEPNRAAPLFGMGESYRRGGDQEKAFYYLRLYAQSAADDVDPARLKQAQDFIGR